jgi:hypothetical protein
MIPLLLAVVVQVAPAAPGPQVDPSRSTDPEYVLSPDTALSPPGGVRILLQRTPGDPAVALHFMVELEESASEAGLASILAEMAATRTAGGARRIGARIEARRTPFGITYSVAGAAEELDYLAWLLRQAAGSPPRDDGAFERARARVRSRVAASRETPAGVMDRRIRQALLPDSPNPNGTLMALDAMHAGMPVEFWNRSHQADRMTLVAVGDVAPVTLLALTRDLGAPTEMAAEPLTLPLPSGSADPRPQILRSWYEQAHRLPVPGDVRNGVLVALAERALRQVPADQETTVELWELQDAAALVVRGAALQSSRSAMEASVQDLVPSIRRTLTPVELTEAVAFVRDEMLFQARTPWGRAELMGSRTLAYGAPSEAARQLDDLEGLDVSAMLSYLDEILAQSPIVERVRP